MPKIYVKTPGKPVGYTSKDGAMMGAIEEHEVEEIQPVMLFGETPSGETFVTHSGTQMSNWAREVANPVIHEFHVYS